MNSFEVLSSEEPGFNESELFHFQSLVPDAKIALQDEPTQLEVSKYPANVSLLAVSSKFGYYVAGTPQGFVYGSTKILRNTTSDLEKGAVGTVPDKIEITVSSPVQHLQLTADETQIVVNTSAGEILIYNAKNIVEQGASAQPVKTFQLAGRVIDIRPNPGTLPTVAAVILDGNRCQIIDLTTGDVVASIDGDDVTAICWSRKGKQLVCGRKNGKLETYTTSGALKASIDPPAAMKAGSGEESQDRYVLAVHWIDTHVFFVTYARPRESSADEHVHDAYIVDRTAESTSGIKYIKLEEVAPVFGMDEREAHMYVDVIRDYSSDMKNAIIVAHSAATDISVVGQDENGDWQVWALPENGLAGLPLSEETNMDTFPVGLAIDLSSTEVLPPFDEATSSEPVNPVPVLMYLNDEDHIGAYYCYNNGIASRGEKYAGMIEPRDVREAESTAPAPATPAPAATPVPAQQQQMTSSAFGVPESKPAAATSQPSGFASSPFGAALAQPANENSFAALLSGGSAAPSTQPTGGFNTSAGVGGFGSFRNLSLSSNAKAPNTNLSVFSGDNKPSFGSPSFGSPSFGSPSFGSSSFGVTNFGGAPPSAPATGGSFADLAKTAQMNKTPSTGFGGLTSNSTTNAPTFGMSSFGTTQENRTGNQPLSMAPGAFGTAKATPASETTGFGITPPSTTTTSFQASTPAVNVPAFGAKAKPEEEKTNATEKAETLTPSEDAATKPVTSETVIKAEPVEEAAPKEKEASEPVSSTKEEASLSTGLGAFGSANTTTTTMASTTATSKDSTTKSTSFGGFGLGDLSKTLDTVESPADAPAPSTTTPAATSTFGSFGQSTSGDGAGKLSFAEIGKSAQSLPKTTGFGSGASLFGGGSAASAPSFGTPLFGSTTGTTATPTFGTTSFGSKTPAPSLAKQTTPSLTSGSTLTESGNKPIEKPAAAPLFGQPAASKLTPAVSAPSKSDAASTSSFSFGSTPTATAIPTKASPAAAAVSPLRTPTLTATSSPKPETPAQTAPKPKPSAEENMANEFESLYFLINDSFKKLDLKQDNLKSTVDAYRKQSAVGKSIDDLDNESSWRVDDVQDLGVVADQVIGRAQGLRPKIIKIQESLGYFDEDTMKMRAKEATIAELVKSEPDAEIKKELNDRELDQEASVKWEKLKSRSKLYGDQLDDLESKLQDYKKKLRAPVRAKSSSGDDLPSLYGLYVQLREIDKELKSKEATVKDLEDRFAYARFKAIHDRARHSCSGIGLNDDDEEEEEEDENDETSDKDTIRTEGPWSDPLIECTARRLRREQFLDKVWQFQSQKSS